jgi:hypothetical protein
VGAYADCPASVTEKFVLVNKTGEKVKEAMFFDWFNGNNRRPRATKASCSEVGAPKLVGSWYAMNVEDAGVASKSPASRKCTVARITLKRRYRFAKDDQSSVFEGTIPT